MRSRGEAPPAPNLLASDSEARSLSMTVLMMPDTANFSGNVHGGIILKYLDQVAYTCATRFSRQYMVTASVDLVRFLRPIHVGDLVTFLAAVNYTGRTSIEVGIRVESENLARGQRAHTNSCYFTMVSVDDAGRPRAVRQLEPRDDEERRRWKEAAERRAARGL